uniref:Uncharacterized protein n=1 Tax=Oryza brachyantha TaxID=4533 RepID=J3MXH6_ORYBR
LLRTSSSFLSKSWIGERCKHCEAYITYQSIITSKNKNTFPRKSFLIRALYVRPA